MRGWRTSCSDAAHGWDPGLARAEMEFSVGNAMGSEEGNACDLEGNAWAEEGTNA